MSFLQEVKFGDLLRKRIVTETTYNSGRKVKEDGYLSGLGVNHKCSCRDVLSLGDVFERNWVKQKDSMGSETQYLEGLGTYDNLAYNTLIITTQRKRNRFGNYVRMHELDISAGPHGEQGTAYMHAQLKYCQFSNLDSQAIEQLHGMGSAA